MSKAYSFTGLLQNEKWITPAYVCLDSSGVIESISNHASDNINYEFVNGYVFPGFQNAHSHAFQYAMVGLTEYHNQSEKQDDFWGWRNEMYKLALSVNPEQLEAIAAMLYAEMLRHGYTHVAEFHYVHHQQDGNEYNNISELGERLISAAKQAGIRITLVPILYQKGGFNQNARENQRRFISKKLEDYYNLLDASKRSVGYYKNATLAYGAHSLRAVDPIQIQELTNTISDQYPFHIHVSEQLREITESLAYLRQRPVEWLLDHVDISQNSHLVHATHMTEEETSNLAKSGAHVVLCPTTEGNLGDGIFPLLKYQDQGGLWSIGTDSHIGLNPFQELRVLDYGQRTLHHKRNIFRNTHHGDSGKQAISNLVINGRHAMGNLQNSFFQKGEPLNALVIDADAPLFSSSSIKNLCSTLVYASDVSMHLGTIVNGKWLVKSGRHISKKLIEDNFIHALQTLNIR